MRTSAGALALASDAAHYYENFEARKPIPLVVELHNILVGFVPLYKLSSSPQLIIPGHSPLVRENFPIGKAEHITRLDQGPKT